MTNPRSREARIKAIELLKANEARMVVSELYCSEIEVRRDEGVYYLKELVAIFDLRDSIDSVNRGELVEAMEKKLSHAKEEPLSDGWIRGAKFMVNFIKQYKVEK